MKRKLILILVFCIHTMTIYSQELNLFLQDIKEERFNGQTQRSTSDSISKITFTTAVNGIRLDNYHFIKLGKLTVVDETGKSLKEIKDSFYKNDRYQNDKKMEFIVEASRRRVTKIEKFQGSLLYFSPTEANYGKVIVRDFLHRRGENLLLNTYAEIALELMDTNKLLDMQEEAQKLIDREVKKRKKEGALDREEQEEINQARQLLTGIMGMGGRSSSHKALTFQLNKALGEAFYRVSIYNGKGKKIDTGYSSVGNLYQFHLTEQPTKDCYIEILIETKDAVKELPFQFQDIILP
ncbi:hypothetical protein HP439_12105 [Sphingobacterium shayense]|uniref:hypothetical protein n=1 Tax=Sphingobacterium shayense TaxID=626343 RepID=UPI00155521EF|nr:hypothetical protein [Sphingobacterium shayense]NQD71466.1 hypothetical protein [Sphingobacterium shayense]